MTSVDRRLQAAERAALEAENGALKAQLAELALRIEAAAEAGVAGPTECDGAEHDANDTTLQVILTSTHCG